MSAFKVASSLKTGGQIWCSVLW